jgi:outer membrane protein insertion porin family
MKKFVVILFLVGAVSVNAWAFEPFVVKDIRVEGLQRISAGTVFNYLNVKINERFDDVQSKRAVKALFKTGFFDDVRLERDGQILVVIVDERPSVDSISFSGNKDIDSDSLKEALKKIGLAEGRVFNRSVLERVEQELQRQYFSSGKYGVKINTVITPLERNRVSILIEVSEGIAARIKEINIIGNNAFDEDDLLDLLSLNTPTYFSFITKSDQYSKLKLSADLETLRSYYLNRGYLNFRIESTQVSITPDKKHIYITININEGPIFTIKEVKLAGRLILEPTELEKEVTTIPGAIYSQRRIEESAKNLRDRLGDEGYAFANVNSSPNIDKENKEVTLTYVIDPGKRVYVRRVNVTGNTRTADEVIRREMRQMEGGWFSTKKVTRSKQRLQRLGYFEEVNVETPAVPGTTDQVDINFTIIEAPSGNFLASVGYSRTGGVLFSTSVQQDNFLGSGKRIGFAFNNSDVNQAYSLSYTNPYYTIDGISRGFAISSVSTDASEANLSDYTTDTDAISVNYGIPINEDDRIGFKLGYESTKLNSTTLSPQEVLDFINKNGNNFDTFKLGVFWSHDTRNKAVFADRGLLHNFSGTIALPGSDLKYYKLSYVHNRFIPLSKRVTLLLKGDIGIARAYGKSDSVPFFENYFAGGTRSVRGFKDNTLGPRDSANNPLGASLKTVANAEVIFPVPFWKDTKGFRLSAFVDVGNVFDGVNNFSVKELRSSVGMSAIWLSPVGPISISLAKPINDKTGDETEAFQFTLGGTF